MIRNEILEIVHDIADKGDLLNAIVNEFRRGRDLTELKLLLNSTDPELVAIGVSILSELNFELYRSQDYVARLIELTDHEDPSVRFHALGALFPALDRENAATLTLLKKLLGDRNEGVRKSAEAAAARLFLK
jgi:hypothetical protein